VIKLFNYSLKTIFVAAICFGLYCLGVIAYGTLTEYHFEDSIKLSQDAENLELLSDSTFELISWNVGFFGLGEESDFFYDGGNDVFQSKKTVAKNMNGVLDFVNQNPSIDFFLFQEVDSFSWRSQKLNFLEEVDLLEETYQSHFGLNYASKFVPIPIANPMGPTYGGLFSMSRYVVEEAFRYDLRTESLWPKRLFFLKRCFLTQRIQLTEKDLVVVNIHNSAYDKSGEKKNKEMSQLLNFATSEYQKGNAVVIGGDWNQSPPNYEPKDMPESFLNARFTDADIPEGWKWVEDVNTPTNRKLDKPYSQELSHTSVIDHFLVSPNVQVDSVAVIGMDFAYSDHQPVYLKVTIK
jgi:endonuclease/exonuclease/phosphatase family metal-dependent hydrolase